MVQIIGKHVKLKIENYRHNLNANLYNTATLDYNGAINAFNEFIQYRNKQFIPLKTDAEIQNMIDQVNIKVSDAKTKLNKIINPDPNIMLLTIQLNKSIDDAVTHVKEQHDWLKIYFSKGKSGRKSMFYEKKITWFGIPIK
jgi:hypothetical protein